MQKLGEIIGIVLLSVVTVFVVAGGIDSCSDRGIAGLIKQPAVVEQALQPVENYLVSEFTSTEEVIILRDQMIEQNSIDSVFLSMSNKTISDVAFGLIRQNGSCTVRDVVKTYLSNRPIFDNLPPDKSVTTSQTDPTTPKVIESKSGDITVVEVPPTRVDGKRLTQTSYQHKDTVIDGKTTEITTKTETYE